VMGKKELRILECKKSKSWSTVNYDPKVINSLRIKLSLECGLSSDGIFRPSIPGKGNKYLRSRLLIFGSAAIATGIIKKRFSSYQYRPCVSGKSFLSQTRKVRFVLHSELLNLAKKRRKERNLEYYSGKSRTDLKLIFSPN